MNILLRQIKEDKERLKKILKEVENLLEKAFVELDRGNKHKAKYFINKALDKIRKYASP